MDFDTKKVAIAAEKARDRDTERYFSDCNPISGFAPPTLLDRFYGDADTFLDLWTDSVSDCDQEALDNIRTTLAQMKELADVIDPSFADCSRQIAEQEEHAKVLGHFIFNLSRRYVARCEAR